MGSPTEPGKILVSDVGYIHLTPERFADWEAVGFTGSVLVERFGSVEGVDEWVIVKYKR